MLKFSNESFGTERTYATEEGCGQTDHDPDSLWTQDRDGSSTKFRKIVDNRFSSGTFVVEIVLGFHWLS